MRGVGCLGQRMGFRGTWAVMVMIEVMVGGD